MYDIMLMNLGIKPKHFNPLVDPPPPKPRDPNAPPTKRTERQQRAVIANLKAVHARRKASQNRDVEQVYAFLLTRDSVVVMDVANKFGWCEDKARILLNILKKDKRAVGAKLDGVKAVIWKAIRENETPV